ncbi:hypothetical protein M404DRAFT_1007167 [Pisolithus tinctorius Marx 270]|uniref:Uncharacterized protein n=1 Tax=Pisolithus tinctorius Marx 270 TaxID=870435 RepID=A0A0C3IFJ1_PISTI|nr:hypothetical protein M404DRAFT_1007167 [Pisolithus tinctorius Marx 270]
MHEDQLLLYAAAAAAEIKYRAQQCRTRALGGEHSNCVQDDHTGLSLTCPDIRNHSGCGP